MPLPLRSLLELKLPQLQAAVFTAAAKAVTSLAACDTVVFWCSSIHKANHESMSFHLVTFTKHTAEFIDLH
jgi:hypothetical protein